MLVDMSRGASNAGFTQPIDTANIIFLNTFGATGVRASCSDKRNEPIKPNFEYRALNFGGWPTFEV
jgi:hypothetical protein